MPSSHEYQNHETQSHILQDLYDLHNISGVSDLSPPESLRAVKSPYIFEVEIHLYWMST